MPTCAPRSFTVPMSLVEVEFYALSRSEDRVCQRTIRKIPEFLNHRQPSTLGRGMSFLTQRDLCAAPRPAKRDRAVNVQSRLNSVSSWEMKPPQPPPRLPTAR